MVIGVVTALVVSLTKSTVRPAANVATAGMAAPVLSTVEDFTSVGLVFLAILVPVLVLVAVVAAGVGGVPDRAPAKAQGRAKASRAREPGSSTRAISDPEFYFGETA